MPRDQSQWSSVISDAAHTIGECARRISDAGYCVQTLRVVTNPFGEYLDTSSAASALLGMTEIQQILTSKAMPQGTRIRFAIGAAVSAQELEIVPELIRHSMDLANCCVNIPCDEMGFPDKELTLAAARCCAKLAVETERGEGNFNFTANFNMPPGCPYFPAAYNMADCGTNFAIGLEYPGLMVDTLKALPSDSTWTERFTGLTSAIRPHVDALDRIAQAFATEKSLRFAGFDSSAAPSKETASMAEVCKALGLPHFGAAGTVQCASFLTRVFQSLGKKQGGDVDLVGFSGFMLACLEDTGLAEAAAAGKYDIRALLTYSAVCGIGLDTVPIPGDTTVEQMAALMMDTGTMAFRLQKPLTVRLFPCPGQTAGEMTTFTSSDLCNCSVFAVP